MSAWTATDIYAYGVVKQLHELIGPPTEENIEAWEVAKHTYEGALRVAGGEDAVEVLASAITSGTIHTHNEMTAIAALTEELMELQ